MTKTFRLATAHEIAVHKRSYIQCSTMFELYAGQVGHLAKGRQLRGRGMPMSSDHEDQRRSGP
ncbi:hypothetical protein E4U19_002570 [Claviceps sp. Clav32 group G5]|nr:hypothetical protein E4U19_002570 [Claviceps sp. Clav32 group G5]KAG6029758.1 hypothetical protein E4U40_000316 [Claviceps sp. LM458 group G5]